MEPAAPRHAHRISFHRATPIPPRSFRSPHRPILCLTFATLLATQTHPTKAATPDTFTGQSSSLWSDPTNWTAGTPNSAAFDVYLTNSTGLSTLLDASETINNLFITNPNTLTLQPATTLTFAGSSLSNTGTILINQSTLVMPNGSALTGGGIINLLDPHSVIAGNITSDNSITGQGTLAISANKGTLAAGVGESLSLISPTLDNSHGVIDVGSGVINLRSTLNGGTITGSGGTLALGPNVGLVTSQPPTFFGTLTMASGLSTQQITNSTTVSLSATNQGTLTFRGAAFANGLLTNNNTFIFAPSGAGIPYINFSSNGTSLINNGTLTGSVELGPEGNSNIRNTGLIVAHTADVISIYGQFSNSGTLLADGGTLNIEFDKTLPIGGTIKAINNGIINLGGVIDGATLDVASGGAIIPKSQFVEFAHNVTINTLLQFADSTAVNYANGASLLGTGTLVLTTAFGPAIEGASFSNAIALQVIAATPNHTVILAGQNSGTITTAGPSALKLSFPSFTNTGLLQATSAPLTLTGNLVNSGQILQSSTASTTTITNTGTSSGLVNTGLILATAGSLVLQGLIHNTGGLIQSTNGAPISISNATITGGSLTISGVALPPGLLKDQFINLLNPPTVSVSNSLVQLDTFSSTAFTSPASVSFQATTISVTNSTLSISGGLSLSNGASLAFNSGSLSVQGPITLNYLDNLSDPSALAFPHIYFNSTFPNSQNVSTISGTGGGVDIGPGASLTSDGDTIEAIQFSGTSKMTIRPNGADSGTSKFRLYYAAGTTNNWSSTLDITNNKLIIQCEVYPPDYPPNAPHFDKPSQFARIINQIESAENGPSGPWTGTGITSSTLAAYAASDNHAMTLAVVDNALLHKTIFGGQQVDDNSLLVTIALNGDTNLDGSVGASDLLNLLKHYNTPDTNWTDGNSTNDPTLGSADLLALLKNYNTSLPAFSLAPANPALASPVTPVPEPASLALAFLAAPFLLKRRRARQSTAPVSKSERGAKTTPLGC